MIPLQIFAGGLGVTMAALILWMIRRDRLPVSHSLWWLTVSAMIALFGLMPGLLDTLAQKTAILEEEVRQLREYVEKQS